jgi:hypothetical protein
LKLLLIISQFTPAQTPNTLRWLGLIKAFQGDGHHIEVLTTRRKGFPSGDMIDGIKTHRAGFNSLKDALYDWLGIASRRNESSNRNVKNSLLHRMLEKLTDMFWRNNYWPDGAQLFVKPGIKMGNDLMKTAEFTHIISVGLPFSCHLIAQSIKSDHPQLKWLMDIQDPFCYSDAFWVNNFKKYTRKNIEAEQEAFEVADAIALTNDVAKKKYVSLFPNSQSKMAIIPPLIIPPEKLATHTFLPAGKLHLAYMGSFYEQVRSPLNFLKFLDTIHRQDPEFMSSIHIHIIGQADRISHDAFNRYSALGQYISFHGFLRQRKAVDLLSSADILLNFGNTTNYHLPSKTVEYLYINKPVVNIISREDDSSRHFWGHQLEILNLNLSHTDSLHVSEFKKFILKSRTPNDTNDELCRPYYLNSIYAKYKALLQN